LPKEQSVGLITYVRPGSAGSDITLSIRAGGRTFRTVKVDRESAEPVNASSLLYLAVGSRMPGLMKFLNARPGAVGGQGQPADQPEESWDDARQRRRLTFIGQVEQLPTRWFGYQAVDILLLTSGSEDFIKRLSADRSGRLEALAEWVRRGGRMVISAGHNQQFVAEVLARLKLLDCRITGTRILPQLPKLADWSGEFRQIPDAEIALLEPGPATDVRVVELDDQKKPTRPVVVEAACGLGHVMLVGLDLDAPPFTGWVGQGAFWNQLLVNRLEPRLPDPVQQPMMGFGTPTQDELATTLKESLEDFSDVTVISFGWVALFILIYILVVGPLDYLFLKKVVKRLELTWVTFPVVVLVVSAAAYFTAYYLKGNDLKINKLDVVDIDLTSPLGPDDPRPQVYGSTWFTLFSPRIQHYTIGIEPSEPAWGAAARSADAEAAPLVDWLGAPQDIFGGTGRTGSQSLFRRAYQYADGASGLEGVPIQVWATKSFSASWVMPRSANRAPVTADVRHAPGNAKILIGSITSHLPVNLQDVVVFYRGHYFTRDGLTLAPDVPLLLTDIGVEATQGAKSLNGWFNASFNDFVAPTPEQRGTVGTRQGQPFSSRMKPLLFHKAMPEARQGNTALRHIDQSWRLDRQEEVVLFGRVNPRAGEGPAEKISNDGVSPSRLWLGELPGSGRSRPSLAGTLTQRTYVRVYIPVTPQNQ
jgi:hypothetical protein